MMPLKEATGIKHKVAERMPFNIRMFKGLLSKQEYLLYLHQELRIFQTIEKIGLPYSGLKRVENVQADIDELKSQVPDPGSVLGSTKAYAAYLASLSAELILPHVYLNYMAIMFGGQMMKKAVPSTGRMYDFDNMQESIQSIRNVQKDEWAEEVNKGYDFIILIFEELETSGNTRLLKND
jgi:heme oxygenase